MARMTIGALSRRTGVPVKTLREYEDRGLIYTVGRSEGNYRLFDDEALWCVAMVGTLRGLGLTLAEIEDLAVLLTATSEPIGPRLVAILQEVKEKARQRIDDQLAMLKRIERFEEAFSAELGGEVDLRAFDPRSKNAS